MAQFEGSCHCGRVAYSVEADLDQIGMLTEVPSEEPHASAYQGALDGEVSIIRFS